MHQDKVNSKQRAMRILIWFLIPLTIHGCGTPVEMSLSSVLTETRTITGGSECACGGKEVYAKNISNRKVEAHIKEEQIVGLEVLRTNRLIRDIDPQSEIYLGCAKNKDPNSSSTSRNCSQTNNFSVTNIYEANYINTRISVVPYDEFIPPESVRYATTEDIEFELVPEPEFQCPYECKDEEASSGLCFSLPLQPDLVDAIHDLAERLGNPSVKVIEKADIMELFDQAEDPCNRSDLHKDASIISNNGSACAFEFSTETGEVASFIMPQEMIGEVSQDDGIDLIFANRASQPKLEFDDELLDTEFGGRVWRITKKRDEIFLKTANGCFMSR